MASRIQENEYQNKLKYTAALDETKTALESYIKSTFKRFHQTLLGKCNQSHISDKHGYNMYGRCFYEINSNKKDKDPTIKTNCSFYKKVFSELMLLDNSEREMCWSNCNLEDFVDVSNSWAIARLFMPPSHKQSSGPSDIDAVTIFTILNSCKLFEPINHQLLDKLTDDPMHQSSSNDKETMTNSLQRMIELLELNKWTKDDCQMGCENAVKEIKLLIRADVRISLGPAEEDKIRKVDSNISFHCGATNYSNMDHIDHIKTEETASRSKKWHILSQKQGVPAITATIYNTHQPDTKGDIGQEQQIDYTVLYDQCKIHGRKSPAVVGLCKLITKEMNACSKSIKAVVPSYKPENENEIIFVIMTENESEDDIIFPPTLSSFLVQYQNVHFLSTENKYVMESEQVKGICFMDNEMQKLKETLREHSKTLMEEHKNLNIIVPCQVKSRNYSNHSNNQDSESCPDRILHQACVVFFVATKGLIPIEEDALPSELNGFPTDVREGCFEFYSPEADEYHTNIKMGCKISTRRLDNGQFHACTIGPFVDIPHHGVCCITSAHAVLNSAEMRELEKREKVVLDIDSHKMYQPSPYVDNSHFGHVHAAAFKSGGYGEIGFEAALIKITEPARCPLDGNFPDCNFEHTGYTSSKPMEYLSGEIYTTIDTAFNNDTVHKYGFSTGLTRGAFVLQGASVRKSTFNEFDCKFGICLHDQIMVVPIGPLPFADHGDSGSLVLAKTGNSKYLRGVGIVSGGSKDKVYVFVTPISSILKAFGLDQKLKPFPSPIDVDNVSDDSVVPTLEQRVSTLENTVSAQRNEITKDITKKIEESEQRLLRAILSSKN